MIELIFIAIVALICFSFYMMYVSLVKKKNKVQEAFSSIDVQLKKRYDLIPNILTNIPYLFPSHTIYKNFIGE